MTKIYWIIIITLTILLILQYRNNKPVDLNKHLYINELDNIRESIHKLSNIDETKNPALDDLIKYCVDRKIWKYYYQRPNVYQKNLTAKPIWNPKDFNFVKKLENNFDKIEKEVDMIEFDPKKKKLITQVNENIYTGKWNDLFFYTNGNRNNVTCQAFPEIAKIIDSIPEIQGVNPGCVCLSFIYPGSKVVPHFGISNNKLRLHLGIKNLEDSTLYVKDKGFNKNCKTLNLNWEKGKVFIFDDSFKHWVINNSKGDKPRIILLIDLWHPDLNKDDISKMENDQSRFFTKYPYLKSLILDNNVKTLYKIDEKNVTIKIDKEEEYNLGKYLTKIGIKHLHYDKNKNNVRVTYDDESQELIQNL
jgi:aspartyl/asparaginyl beta-hydroxylase (cupin superfamily)